jgi:hypothetical protein
MRASGSHFATSAPDCSAYRSLDSELRAVRTTRFCSTPAERTAGGETTGVRLTRGADQHLHPPCREVAPDLAKLRLAVVHLGADAVDGQPLDGRRRVRLLVAHLNGEPTGNVTVPCRFIPPARPIGG